MKSAWTDSRGNAIDLPHASASDPHERCARWKCSSIIAVPEIAARASLYRTEARWVVSLPARRLPRAGQRPSGSTTPSVIDADGQYGVGKRAVADYNSAAG